MAGSFACEDLRVVELADGAAGSMAGMILADNGADVVKVEPPGGSPWRDRPGFAMWNRGKSSLVLDLRRADDRARVLALAADADVVLESWRPGVAERLGVDHATLSMANPALVTCAISGFGPLTELASVRGYDHVVSAAAGKMSLLDDITGKAAGRPPEVPTFAAAPVNCYAAANLAVHGVLAALSERATSGRGQHVTTSLFQGAFAGSLLRTDMRRAERDEDRAKNVERLVMRHRGVRLAFLTAECADGKFIQMCARQDHHFRNWLTAIGLEDVLAEERYADLPLGFRSVADADELEVLIRARMRERSQDEWMKIFIEDVDVGADPFLTFEEFLAHPQMLANDRIVHVHDPLVGPTTQVGPLALFSETPSRTGAPAARPGEHDATFAWARPRAATPAPVPVGDTGAPLQGVTVLEVATYLAGPWGATLLAELGARVIKVEPLDGDTYRRSGYFVHVAHGKESLAVDLKHPRGTAVLHRLATRADALLSNFRPGVPERLGFDYATLSAIAPQLVYVYAGSYGSRGPQSHRAAFHSTPNALSGGGILQGGEGNPPVDDGYPDPCGGIGVATAVLLGLHARRLHGRGQFIETSMLSSAGYVHSDDLVEYEGRPPRHVVDHDQQGFGALYRLYAIDGAWMFVAAVGDDQWQALAGALGHPEWTADARFADDAARRAHDRDLADEVRAALGVFGVRDAVARLRAADVAAVPVDPDTSLAELIVARGLVTAAEHPDFGPYWKHLPGVDLSRSRTTVGPPCGVGEHSEAILAEAGFSEAEIRSLADDRVVSLGGLG